MQISPATPEMQAVIHQQAVSSVQQPLEFDPVVTNDVQTEVV